MNIATDVGIGFGSAVTAVAGLTLLFWRRLLEGARIAGRAIKRKSSRANPTQ
jgi:hypothetical protein